MLSQTIENTQIFWQALFAHVCRRQEYTGVQMRQAYILFPARQQLLHMLLYDRNKERWKLTTQHHSLTTTTSNKILRTQVRLSENSYPPSLFVVLENLEAVETGLQDVSLQQYTRPSDAAVSAHPLKRRNMR